VSDSVTPKKEWQEEFLAALEQAPNVSKACRAAEVSRQTAYRTRHEDPAFAASWDEAIDASLDGLEEAAFSRAKRESDTLTIFLLKSHRPERYRERQDLNLNVRDVDAAIERQLARVAVGSEAPATGTAPNGRNGKH
jgi:hypothetical protein